MNEELDHLLAKLHAQPLARDLGGLEREVRLRLVSRTPPHLRLFAPVHALVLISAVLVGGGVGGVAASSSRSPVSSLFAEVDSLAPSTLLDGAH